MVELYVSLISDNDKLTKWLIDSTYRLSYYNYFIS